jgi:L-lactate dehydrogenase
VTVGSITLREYLAMNHHSGTNIDFDEVKRMVKESGSKIVGGKGCTEFGIASVVAEIITAVLHNEKRMLPLSVHLEGEYGESGISAGTPCIVGSNGIDAVLEIDLSYDERRAMRNSCSIIRGYVEQVMPEVPAQE